MKTETKKPTVVHKRITPEVAKALLDKNPANRRLNPSIVNRYAQILKDGQWKMNGDTLKVDVDGQVLDGQHRLAAIVQTGVSIDAILVTGLEREVFDTIDTGKPRSSADALFASGLRVNASIVSAIANLAIKMETDSLKNNRYIEPHRVREWVTAHPEAEDAAATARKMSGVLGFAPVLGLVYLLAKKADEKAATKFFTDLSTGEMIARGDPAYALREALIRHKSDRSMHKATVLAMAIRAWNSFKSEEKLTVLKKPKTIPNGYAYAL